MSLLEASQLCKYFGGLRAVDQVDFGLEEGEIHAVIGPNGAGKTTFVSLLCGRLEPSAGKIKFGQLDITLMPAWRRARMGIAYTFQITSIYTNLSVFDNVAIAAQHGRNKSGTIAQRANHAIEQVGLGGKAGGQAGSLAYGHQRLLEVAMGLALAPRLLILDEPTQGLSDSEIDHFCELVRQINARSTVLLIEHNMQVVMSLADRITVFDRGSVLAMGNPEEIRSNNSVQAAYLGAIDEGNDQLLLQIQNLNSFYGEVQVVRGLDLALAGGEVLCLMGRNGAGKTTLLKSIMGLVRHSGGVLLCGDNISGLPAHEVPKHGIGYVPQGRRLFAELTVRQNLQIGLMARGTAENVLNDIFSLFPLLRERLDQESGTLSGGEQQMLAMARALCLQPRLLLLDEPTEGLMPSMIVGIREVIATLRDQGVGILLVEQRVEAVLSVADRVAFMENGTVRQTVGGEQIRTEPGLLQRYVGVATA